MALTGNDKEYKYKSAVGNVKRVGDRNSLWKTFKNVKCGK